MIIWSGVGIWGIFGPLAFVYFIILGEKFSDKNQWLVLMLAAPFIFVSGIILDKLAIYFLIKLGGPETKTCKAIRSLSPMSLSFVDRATFFFIPIMYWGPISFMIGIFFLIFDANIK